MCYNKNMKKNKVRLLSIFFCFIFLFCVGCDGGLGYIGEDSPVQTLSSVKVLSKPADYNFAEAVGKENSQYYYNLLSSNILAELVEKYRTGSYSENADKYLDYDAIRYGITKTYEVQDEDGYTTSQIVTLDLSKAWNWGLSEETLNSTVELSALPISIISHNADYGTIEKKDNTFVLTFNENYFNRYENWHFNINTVTTDNLLYSDYFYNREDKQGKAYYDNGVLQYLYSPYYKDEAGTEYYNYYQDALEYATYLFVLGYDYKVDTDDAKYFDFKITYNPFPSVRVGGWNVAGDTDASGYTSIEGALGQVKLLYSQVGAYVGLTEDNKQQLTNFILEKVIGLEGNDAKNNWTMEYYINGVLQPVATDMTDEKKSIEINRNYEEIVTNIVENACNDVKIGGDESSGTAVNITDAYLISKITDYEGDYFFQSYKDENGNIDDSDLFTHIEEAEYQCLSLKVKDEDVGSNITDIWLNFQYYDTGTTNRNLKYLDQITINIGINYYNSTTDVLTTYSPIHKTIKYGQKTSFDYYSGEQPDTNWVYFTTSSAVSGNKVKKISEIPVIMSFDNKLDGGILDAEQNGEAEGDYKKSITITGNTDARKYYKMNKSSSYGVYGTFNEEMFKDKSDYVEIYFDVVKVKGVANVNYNFKVGLVNFCTDSWKN